MYCEKRELLLYLPNQLTVRGPNVRRDTPCSKKNIRHAKNGL